MAGPSIGSPTRGPDCDDTRPDVHPDVAEICDHIDNNCNGLVDETAMVALYLDADGDGHGDPSQPILACQQDAGGPAGGQILSNLGNDCDDQDPRVWIGADCAAR
jgi:hypothetical protein